MVQRIEHEELWIEALPTTRATAVLTAQREKNSKLEHGTARITARWGRVAGCLHHKAMDFVNWTEAAPPGQIASVGPTTKATKE